VDSLAGRTRWRTRQFEQEAPERKEDILNLTRRRKGAEEAKNFGGRGWMQSKVTRDFVLSEKGVARTSFRFSYFSIWL
jgi:hypothetical protein